jgi:hypothetical protein
MTSRNPSMTFETSCMYSYLATLLAELSFERERIFSGIQLEARAASLFLLPGSRYSHAKFA